jgi:hypothetical protein
MIWESGPWKREVWRTAESLARRRTQRCWPQSSLCALEMDLFGALYAVRKLMEARKLSDDVVGRTVAVDTYPPRGKQIHLMNWDKIHELYDLEAGPRHEELSVNDFANQVIHSYVFVPVTSLDGLQGFFLASDHQRARGLHHVTVDRVIELLRAVGADDITDMRQVIDPSRGDWVIIEARDRTREQLLAAVAAGRLTQAEALSLMQPEAWESIGVTTAHPKRHVHSECGKRPRRREGRLE